VIGNVAELKCCMYVCTEDIYSKMETFESRTVVVKIMDTSESVRCIDIDSVVNNLGFQLFLIPQIILKLCIAELYSVYVVSHSL